MTAFSKSRFTFDVLKQLPYECDSRSEQLSKLEFILSKLYGALTVCSWASIAKWDSELEKWLQLEYRLPRKAHTTLVSIYYELAITLNLPEWVDRKATDRFRELLDLPSCPDESCNGNVCTHPIDKRYLTVADLQLDWRLAFGLMEKQLHPLEQYSATITPSYSFDAELVHAANAFFPAEETKNVLDEVLPLFSSSHSADAFVAIGVLSFLLPTSPSSSEDPSLNPQTWLPTIFHLYNMSTRSTVADTMFFDIFARLAASGLSENSKYQFSEYGVFTPEQARALFHYGLRLFDVDIPNGMTFFSNSEQYTVMSMFNAASSDAVSRFAEWIVCSLSSKCEETGDSILTMLSELFSLILQYYHPSVSGSSNEMLYQFIAELSQRFLKRWTYENDEQVSIPKEKRLTEAIKKEFVAILKPSVFFGIYSRTRYLREMAQVSLWALAILEPDVIVPSMLKRIYPALQSLLETHRTLVSLESLISLAQVIASTKRYQPHILPLLELILPGIDPNDCDKTKLALQFVAIISHCVSFHNIDEYADPNLFLHWFQMEMAKLEQMKFDNPASDNELDEGDVDYDKIMASAMTSFCDWLLAFEGRVFTLLENFPDGDNKESIEKYLSMTMEPLLDSLSDEWLDLALSKVCHFISTNVVYQSIDAINKVCAAFMCTAPEKTWKTLYPILFANIFSEIDENKAGLSRGSNSNEILPRDRMLVWNLSILRAVIGSNGKYFIGKEDELTQLLDKLLLCRGFTGSLTSSFVLQLVFLLISVYPAASPERLRLKPEKWGRPCDSESFKMCWNMPSKQEIELAIFLCNRYMTLCMDRLQELVITNRPHTATIEWIDEVCTYFEWLNSLTSASAEMYRVPDEEFVPESKHDEYNTYTVDYQYVRSAVRSRWNLASQQSSIMSALRERLGSLLIELHNVIFDSVDYDVCLLANLVTCEKSFLLDYEYPESLRLFENITFRYNLLASYFSFKPQKQPFNATLLGTRIYSVFLNHLRLSYVTRIPTANEKTILKQLIKPCCSQYAVIRLAAQASLASCVVLFRDTRLEIFQSLVDILNKAEDVDVLEGSIGALVISPSLFNMVKRQWVFLSPLLHIIIRLQRFDKPILQTIASRVFENVITSICYETFFPVYEHRYVPKITSPAEIEELNKLSAALKEQRQRDQEAALKTRDAFVEILPGAHWKIQELITHAFYSSFANFFIPPTPKVLELMGEGTISSHPTIRTNSFAGFVEVMYYIWEVSLSKGNTKDLLCQNIRLPNEITLKRNSENVEAMKRAIFDFRSCRKSYCVLSTYPGWLVLPDHLDVLERTCSDQIDFSAVQDLVDTAVKVINESWLQKLLSYLVQEPRVGTDADDSSARGKWRINVVYIWEAIFKLLFSTKSYVSTNFLHKQVETLCSSSDRFCNRAGTELLTGIILSLPRCKKEIAEKHWNWIVPLVTALLQTGLSSENLGFWSLLIQTVFMDSDPTLYWPLYHLLVNLHLNVTFKHVFWDSARLKLMRKLVETLGWHFQFEQPLYDLLLSNLQQPYEKYRKEIGSLLAELENAQIHESYESVDALLKANSTEGPLGAFFGKNPTTKLTVLIKAYEKLELLRIEAKDSSDRKTYVNYASTMARWTEKLLMSPCGFIVLPIVPGTVLPAVLHMLDAKDDDDLQNAAAFLLQLLGNLTYPTTTVDEFCDACLATMKNQDSWHHRLHILAALLPFMFRHSFIASKEIKLSVLEALVTMLDDTQLEVREGAAVSMAMLVHCFTKSRLDIILNLRKRFLEVLDTTLSPISKLAKALVQDEYNELIAQRHAAVLGLSALVNSISFDMPPDWMKPILLRLTAITNHPHPIGASAKKTITDFRKSRSDVWQFMDSYFTREELDELRGVSSHSYFA
ncbi:hypothetical protein SJAG_02625 [Schizosaccharomyces japonicus yFS275]|uniref:Uncharacterized protein n=1 Tax=Schizosaccharomyces japonicus (strain yFS275 / FY16936) TaxID=402676 RepID=B6K0R6_SCHJY|nr:hypothetical protein SJAG_02625 [Schizosaccharomyces japonicus yFS275]EEB07537.1 hypothetical protein SJAG_02625 [Schizosaccharomyces japonicus yFS275]